MAVVTRADTYFTAATLIEWVSAGNPPQAANTLVGFYGDPTTGVRATLVPVDPVQNVQEHLCSPAAFPCNVDVGRTLLIADNRGSAPVHIQFVGNGVSAVGSYGVAKWNSAQPPVAYTASLYVRLMGSGPDDWIAASAMQGKTGPIWSPAHPSFAPFVGCGATASDRIVAARFDLGHGQNGDFSPVGITNLWIYA